MDHLADRLDQAADALAEVDRRLPGLAVGAVAFGGDDAGVPGRIGRDLHARWVAALQARSREAADLAGRLTEAAGAVRETARDYDATDDAVRRRMSREM